MELQRLIDAVECGDDWRDLVGWCDYRNQCAESAFNGSLDAAKDLHDALLPGWLKWNVQESVFGYEVDITNGILDASGCSKDSPARAWLLAILKAYQQVQK